MRLSPAWMLGVFALLACGAGVLRLLVGWGGLAWPESPDVLELRLLRLGSGAAVGASLGTAGVLLQSLLRNPLAAPDLMGLASGSGFAVMLATYLHFLSGAGLVLWGGYAGPALAGSLGALLLVYALSQRSGLIDPVTMVLTGVVVGLLFSAGTVFLQHQLPDRGQSTARWLMGALDDNATAGRIALVGSFAVAATAGAVLAGDAMDAASTSEDEARSLGVPLGVLRAGQFIAAGVLTAGSVVLAGPIGFVGLVAPHVARLLGGPGHAVLAPAAALLGAALVIGADALVKSVQLGGGRLPIGVLTAAVGAPVFIALLRAQRRG